MTGKAIFGDLEDINQFLIRCEECGTPFVEEEHLKNHVHQKHESHFEDSWRCEHGSTGDSLNQ